MSNRKEGWYWVQITPRISADDDGWEAVKYEGGLWFMAGRSDYLPEGLIYSVGPRIPTPDEMEGWQVVPKKMDRGMMSAAIPNDECSFPNYGPQEDEMQDRYGRALQAAPKPGDV